MIIYYATCRRYKRFIAVLHEFLRKVLHNSHPVCILYSNEPFSVDVRFQTPSPPRVQDPQSSSRVGHRSLVFQQFLLRSSRPFAGPLRDDPLSHERHNAQGNRCSVRDVHCNLYTSEARLSQWWTPCVNSKASRAAWPSKDHLCGGRLCASVPGRTWRYEYSRTRRTGWRAFWHFHPFQCTPPGTVKKKLLNRSGIGKDGRWSDRYDHWRAHWLEGMHSQAISLVVRQGVARALVLTDALPPLIQAKSPDAVDDPSFLLAHAALVSCSLIHKTSTKDAINF